MKKLLNDPVTGQIFYATVKDIGNGFYIATSKKENLTNDAIKAVFAYLLIKFRENGSESYKITFENKGIPYILEMRKINEN